MGKQFSNFFPLNFISNNSISLEGNFFLQNIKAVTSTFSFKKVSKVVLEEVLRLAPNPKPSYLAMATKLEAVPTGHHRYLQSKVSIFSLCFLWAFFVFLLYFFAQTYYDSRHNDSNKEMVGVSVALQATTESMLNIDDLNKTSSGKLESENQIETNLENLNFFLTRIDQSSASCSTFGQSKPDGRYRCRLVTVLEPEFGCFNTLPSAKCSPNCACVRPFGHVLGTDPNEQAHECRQYRSELQLRL